jgi:hypothetical protein
MKQARAVSPSSRIPAKSESSQASIVVKLLIEHKLFSSKYVLKVIIGSDDYTAGAVFAASRAEFRQQLIENAA